ncbi:MAG: type I restriction endonuclease subunit R, partial [Bacteroidetes bacterium]|nr:type I restriction endonuclease subunit R [Bacteroidota bacterium]
MPTPSFQEDHISQIPAIQMLVNLGYTYLTPEEALNLRGGKTSGILLEPALKTQLATLNQIHYKNKYYPFSDANLNTAIQALKDYPIQEGYITASEYIYNLLTLGNSLEQSIEGDKKSFTLQYIDWEKPERNVYHVTEEMSVLRNASHEHYRPDIVLFVNGIPFCVIECKRPDMKDPLDQAISQHLRNQQEDGIRGLYVYSQLCLSLATNQAKYGTNATKPKFWSKWQEKFRSEKEEKNWKDQVFQLKNTPLAPAVKDKLFQERFRYVRHYFDALEKEEIKPTIQDEYLYALCRPDRMLDLAFRFTLYDEGVKKVARYQQFFAVKQTLERVKKLEKGRRKGGVIWHTQGSGKSLTMVMLAQAFVLDKRIRNPKIILVT